MLDQTFVRDLTVLHAQALSAIKRALRNPGNIAETVLEVGPVDEVEIQVIATYRKKLILPLEVTYASTMTAACRDTNHRTCAGVSDDVDRCGCECHEKDHV